MGVGRAAYRLFTALLKQKTLPGLGRDISTIIINN